MCTKLAEGVLRGRPFGGVGVTVHKSLAKDTSLTVNSERLTTVRIEDLYVVNVYLPDTSTAGRAEIVLDICSQTESEYLVRRRLGASRRSTASTLHSMRRVAAHRKTSCCRTTAPNSIQACLLRCSTVIHRRRKRFQAEQVEISSHWLRQQRTALPLPTAAFSNGMITSL